MFLDTTIKKVPAKDAEAGRIDFLTEFFHGGFFMGTYAYGQINDDSEKGVYSAFVTNSKVIRSGVHIIETDDSEAMQYIFEDILKKYNKLNKHLRFVRAEVESTSKKEVKIIVLYYSKPSVEEMQISRKWWK